MSIFSCCFNRQSSVDIKHEEVKDKEQIKVKDKVKDRSPSPQPEQESHDDTTGSQDFVPDNREDPGDFSSVKRESEVLSSYRRPAAPRKKKKHTGAPNALKQKLTESQENLAEDELNTTADDSFISKDSIDSKDLSADIIQHTADVTSEHSAVLSSTKAVATPDSNDTMGGNNQTSEGNVEMASSMMDDIQMTLNHLHEKETKETAQDEITGTAEKEELEEKVNKDDAMEVHESSNCVSNDHSVSTGTVSGDDQEAEVTTVSSHSNYKCSEENDCVNPEGQSKVGYNDNLPEQNDVDETIINNNKEDIDSNTVISNDIKDNQDEQYIEPQLVQNVNPETQSSTNVCELTTGSTTDDQDGKAEGFVNSGATGDQPEDSVNVSLSATPENKLPPKVSPKPKKKNVNPEETNSNNIDKKSPSEQISLLPKLSLNKTPNTKTATSAVSANPKSPTSSIPSLGKTTSGIPTFNNNKPTSPTSTAPPKKESLPSGIPSLSKPTSIPKPKSSLRTKSQSPPKDVEPTLVTQKQCENGPNSPDASLTISSDDVFSGALVVDKESQDCNGASQGSEADVAERQRKDSEEAKGKRSMIPKLRTGSKSRSVSEDPELMSDSQ